MQLYKHACKGKCVGWGEFSCTTSYDPLTMFTSDFSQIHHALATLFLNPQNNLRVSINAKHIYGWDKLDVQPLLDAVRSSDFNEVSDIPAGSEASSEQPPQLQSGIISAISIALAEESLLSRLLSMQKLDLLDSEGAEVVFDRLEGVVLSRETALRMLETQMLKPLHPRVHTLFDRDESDPSAGGEVEDCCCMRLARQLLALSTSEDHEERVQMEQLQKARTLVQDATADQCLFLLQLWMLALIAKDASVIITIRRIILSSLSAEGRRVGDMWVCAQSATHCGTLCSVRPNEESGFFDGYVYTVGVIDIGLKSLDKAYTKAAEDADVCRIVTDSLHSLL